MTVGIVGYGRFGKLLHDILKDDFDILTFDKDDSLEPLQQCDTIFLCVPIRAIKQTLASIATIKLKAVIIDTCSVKIYPVQCMQQQLPHDTPIIATHPLFGPDSYYKDSNNRIMMHPVQHADQHYEFWKDYFSHKQIRIIELTPDEHDRFAARSQGITHLLGRTLQHMGIKSTPIDTLGFERLLGIMNQTCNDSWDLFHDLQEFNPYTKTLVTEIEQSLKSLITTD
jgi:prephenate dehydrogenase